MPVRFSRLRLHGFKSFVDAADIGIEPGLTGIIGPNGCGKSNLIEALRFVMGESSYKAMRGGGMEDVIFSGSANRPSRNLAEVTLVAERSGKSGDSETLEITRRIERESGSTYRINGRETRARDVLTLFADAATGAHSSAFVRQGQIGELIAAKPVQRRQLLEDAAGISGLHSRRAEAEQKLKAAEQNLERLDDVMAELATRLEGLRRQARQAVRYRKISGEIRKSEAILSMLHWQAAIARLTQAEGELDEAVTAFGAAASAHAAAAAREREAAERIPTLRDRAAAAAAAVERLGAALADLDREEASHMVRGAELKAQRAQAAADLKREAEIGSDAAAASARLQAEAEELSAETAGAAARIAIARTQADDAAAAATVAEAEFSASAAAFAAAGAERGARERAVKEAHAKLRRLEEERAAVLKQRDRLHAEHGGDDDLKAAAAAVKEAEAQLAEQEALFEAAETAVNSARETERRARGPYEAAERNLGGLQAEARTLAELLDLERTKRFAPLIDSLDVEPGFEQALVSALGDDLDASLDPEAPAHWSDAELSPADPPLPQGVEPLSRRIKGPSSLARRLAQVGIVEETRAAELAGSLATGQRLVTRDGGLWRWDGFRARPGSAAAGARRLEQRNRVALLVQELKKARQSVDKTAALFESARQVRAEAEAIDVQHRNAVRAARQELDAKRAALVEAERRASRVVERLSAFAGALARIDADTDATRVDLRTAGEALEVLPDTTDLEARRDALQARLAQDRAKATDARMAVERAAHEESLRSRRLADIAAERERWGERAARAGERVAEIERRLAALDNDIAAHAEKPATFARRREALRADALSAEEAATAAASELGEAERQHHDAAEAARIAQEKMAEAREARARDEERLIAATARRDELAAQIQEHFGRPPDDLLTVAGLLPDAEVPAAASVEARLQKLRNERDRLGGVNLRAEEEARELETRLDGMRSEHADLEEAIKRLRQGIQSLNKEGRERLLSAFAAVNGHFSSLFQHLFGGGTAELTLTGSDDPLEAGLEIVARPPGKRPHTMTLLSGGEQALTALALIFAVFLTNPSPICVLDEVDAPLDDANVERFCELLDDMRRRTDTRFVVVTHNPITMARMDRLYGVTMAERGVSQVVSVDLEAAEQFREAS
jgi:chromosome segregation protein